MTSPNPITLQGRRLLRGAASVSVSMLLAASAHAQGPVPPRPPPVPDEAQIQRTVNAVVLCQWPVDAALPGYGEFWYVTQYLHKTYWERAAAGSRERSNESYDGTNTLGAFEVLGTYFDEVKIAGFMGGGAGIAWSASGDKQALQAVLRGQGYVFNPVNTPIGPGLEGRHAPETGTRAVLILDGRLQDLGGKITPGGFTVLCRPDRPQ